MKTLVIIPTYNERDNIKELVEVILSLPYNLGILIVDDNSPDGTGTLADSLHQRDGRVSVLHRAKKEGLGRAYVDAYKYALTTDADYFIQLDGDFSHSPNYIPQFLESMESCDVAVGSRLIGGGAVVTSSAHRYFYSLIANLYLRLTTAMPLRDWTSGYKCLRRKVIEAIGIDRIVSAGYEFQIEMNYRSFKRGFKIRELPIVFYNRKSGRSKMPVVQFIFNTLFIVWALRMIDRN